MAVLTAVPMAPEELSTFSSASESRSINVTAPSAASIRYVDLHVQSHPSIDRVEFAHRLRQAVDARKAGARCACGGFIWAIGSAEAGAACFTCITGEAWPDSDYEIDEALGLSPG